MKNSILTIAGSDSGGGAGIQADLKTFNHFGLHGTSVITAITAQNPNEVLGVQGVTPEAVEAQLQAVFDYFPIKAVKTGMLLSSEIIQTVVSFWKNLDTPPKLVIDPVMVATSGAYLLQEDAQAVLAQEFFPLASLITPNLPEAEALLGYQLQEISDGGMAMMVQELYEAFEIPVLLKGGHAHKDKQPESVDWFYDGTQIHMISGEWVANANTHGTGCRLSSAIASQLALGNNLLSSIEHAKEFLQQQLLQM